ncbi:hypothetical protein H5410_022093, partial [Solanum commersonii]
VNAIQQPQGNAHGYQHQAPRKKSNNMSMEEMLKKIMVDQAQISCLELTDPVRKWQLLVRGSVFGVGRMYLPHPQYQRAKPGGSGDSLVREFPQILRRIHELHMEFIFVEPGECN